MSTRAAFHPRRRYSVIEDFDGLHVVPTLSVIRRGETLVWSASLAECGEFVAAYLAEIAAGNVADAH
jgi:hypothetical protein